MTPRLIRRPRRSLLAAGAAAFGLSVALSGGVAIAADESVAIADFAFAPATVTITAGDTVTWTNADPVAHTATAVDSSWDTGEIAEGASASSTVNTPGTYAYLCTPHPTMTGTVVVEAAASGGGGAGAPHPTIPPTDAVVAPASGPAGAPDGWSSAAGLLLAGSLVAAAFVAGRRRLTGHSE